MKSVRQLLGVSMGGEPRLGASRAHGRPLAQALRVVMFYALVWASAEALAREMDRPTFPQSVAILAWFGGVIFVRAWISRHTTAQLTQTIEQDILPYASPDFLKFVAIDIECRNGAVRRIVWPLLAACACAVTALVAVTFDLKVGTNLALDLKGKAALILTSPQSWFGIFLMVYGFFLSARSAGAAGFYIAFAERLEIEPNEGFFVLGAADSPLVQGLAKLGSQVLIFWAVIFLAILSSIVLALPWLGDHGLGQTSKFVMLFVPLAGFITLGMGSLVYLRSEAKIRAALRSFTEKQAAVLQERMNTLLAPLAGRIPHDDAELARLTEWHDRILAGGRYGSRIGTAVSIALPLLLPAVSFAWSVVERLLKTG